jgi:hypothetical protein
MPFYIKSKNKQIEKKQVEFSPQFIFRGGVGFKYKTFAINWQISYISKQFTDATNATLCINGSYRYYSFLLCNGYYYFIHVQMV